ncbi:terpenoid synthase [Lindgomyces ingoldianus]|uniref:Terpenoid synthase n=1 Tax=Lindgomyces ingoldianus TaxID=673940 RepID=A0ACB6QPD4_9PLEO|nr:terpenoid synthase [Lindgomyces ingoldianus]KAF2468385.1 terpenoid synthase [Lindgomyces ingoldianus]
MPRHQFEPLFEDLEGVVLVVPAISTLCPDWPLGINPHLESIQEEFFNWVNHWFKEERIRKKIAELNAPGFAAMNYPGAAREQLLTMAKLIAWYFPWDDAIDDGSLYHMPEAIMRYRDETIALVEQSLSWNHEPQEKPHPNPAIQSFWDLGVDIRARGTHASTNFGGTLEANEQFRWAQCAFITSSVQGQVDRELTEPVLVEQYLTRREKNIAVFPLLSLIYYNYQLAIPQEFSFKENKHMNLMWRLLARMGIISNDMLSLRREIMHGQFESLIPLLMYHNNLQAQEAMAIAGDMLHECYIKFNEVEVELYKEIPVDFQTTMNRYVKACKDLIVCNLHWSYGLKRYIDEGMLQPDGRVVFPIRLPPKIADVKNRNSVVSAERKTTMGHKESKRRTTLQKFTFGWSSVIRRAIVPIGLGIVAMFAKEAISMLRRPSRC